MTNQQKYIGLLIGVLATIFICYKLAISKTFTAKKQYQNLKQQELLFKNTPKKLSILQQKQVYYDSILNKYQLNGNSLQNSLLQNITLFATQNNLKIIDFLEPHTSMHNEIVIKTYQFTLQGDYNNIITLIHQLEQKAKFGEIINLQFIKQKNYRTGRYYLQAKVLLKSFS